MKAILTILLFSCLASEAQMMPNGAKYIHSALTAQSPTKYNNHSGTTIVTRKSFTNLSTGTNGGYLVDVGTGTGTGTMIFQYCYFGASINEAVNFENYNGKAIFYRCLFANNKTGLYALNSKNISVIECEFVNMWGARDCRGQFVQFNNVDADGETTGVFNCRAENFRAEGYPEDMISFFQSNGQSGNPITARGNKFRGGGPSRSGGGIMTGDNGGSWQLVENNRLDRPGNYLFAASSGTNITIQNNYGYQPLADWSNIGMYAYRVESGTCSNITVTGNHIYIRDDVYGNNKWYSGGGGAESCGAITGVPGDDFLSTNFDDLTESELAMPAQLITYVSEDQLWKIRDESVQFRDNDGGPCDNEDTPAQLSRPTAVGAGGGAVFNSFKTLTVSGGSTYRWVLVSGPNVPGMSGTTSSSLSLTGLIDGTYRFRVEAYDGAGASDADWVTITVTLT